MLQITSTMFSSKEIINNKSSKNIQFSANRGLRPIAKYDHEGEKNFVFDLITSSNWFFF